MMHNITQGLRVHWPEFTIVVTVFVLGVCNIHWGQYLLGWDSTTPELNFSLNFQRFLFGTWQEYRGLGTQDGMAHTSLIVQWLYAWILDLVLPTTLVRPVLNLLTLLAGGLGMLRLTQDFFLPELQRILGHNSMRSLHSKLLSTAAALLYMLNPLTLQMYHLPLELFSFHFAVIAWGMWALLRFYQHPSKKNALMLLLINVAGASQAHVPTVVVSYAIQLALVSLPFLVSKKITVRLALAAAGVIFASNAFWGLPYIYSTLQKSAEIAHSKQNIIGTPSAFFRNNAWGTGEALSTFGGFTYSYTDWNEETTQFEPIMQEWITLWQHPLYRFFTAGFSIAVFCTALYLAWLAVVKRSVLLSVAVLLFFSLLTLLGTSIPVLAQVSAFFRENIPLYEQIFRFTFTKFSLLYVLSFTVVATLSVALWVKTITSPQGRVILLSVFCLFPILLALPAWQGQLFYSKLWVDLPSSYSQAAAFFAQNKNARVLSLPIHSLWGWTTNTTAWGYRGSGFFWQMNPAPLVDRSFDPWEDSNETAYLQLSQAVYTSDIELFIQLLKTFHISHLLLDTSVFHPGNYQENIYILEIQQLLQDPRFVLTAQYDSLAVYTLREERGIEPYVLSNPMQIGSQIVPYPQVPVSTSDAYITNPMQDSEAVTYPFKYLTSNRPIESQDADIQDTTLTLRIDSTTQSEVNIPDYATYQSEIPLELTLTNSSVEAQAILPWSETPPPAYTFSLPNFPSTGYLTLKDKLVAILSPEKPDLLLYVPSNGVSELTHYSDSINKTFRQSELLTPKASCNHTHDLSQSDTANPSMYCSGGELVFESSSSEQPQTETAPTKELVGVFIPKPSSGSYSICITSDEDPSRCSNSTTQDTTSDTGETLITTSFVRDNSQNYRIEVASTQPVTLRSLVLQTHAATEQFTFDPSAVLQVAQDELRQGIQNRAVQFSLPAAITKISVTNRAVNTNVNCSKKTGSSVEKTVLVSNAVMYSASAGGFLCDTLLLPEISPSQQYLIATQSNTSTGAGFKYFLINPVTKRFDTEWIFPKEGGSELLSVWPSNNPSKVQRSDFQLSITGESFGPETNSITIDSITLLPVPLKWLVNVHTSNQTPNESQLVPVLDFQKFATVGYVFSVHAGADSYAVIPQSFDTGWLAFSLSSFSILPHVEYNGWANAWLVPEGTQKILIIFWPQLLSFAGYGVLLVTLGILARNAHETPLARFWRSNYNRVRELLRGSR